VNIRLGTRGSRLALTQSGAIAAALERMGHRVDTVVLKTQGDKILDVPLAKIGGKGLFTKEIEDALLNRQIDLAVHSLKDVPSVLPAGLAIVAYPEREDPRDAFLGRTAQTLARLAPGAKVGTSSLRRSCQLGALRSDLIVEILRGNVETRLKKLDDGQYDAILLACAGLSRLGLSARITEALDPERFIPAAGQGILALEARVDDRGVGAAARGLAEPATERAAACERAFLARLEGGCQVPMGAHARVESNEFRVTGFVGTPDGKRVLRRSRVQRPPQDAAEAARVGDGLAQDLLHEGAGEILQSLQLTPPVARGPELSESE
jgi:hydroxymethylbilane synthase